MNKQSPVVDLVLVGVGGQGILLASEIIARAAMFAGFQVKTNEVHGMAQRGGSVMAQIRYGQEVHSPLIAEGTAHALVGLEMIEALRAAHFLAPDGHAVVSDQRVIPVTVSSGGATYPADVEARLAQVFRQLLLVPAIAQAQELGQVRAANVVLVGALSTRLDLPADAWRQAVEQSVKPQHRELNLKAFAAGRDKVLASAAS